MGPSSKLTNVMAVKTLNVDSSMIPAIRSIIVVELQTMDAAVTFMKHASRKLSASKLGQKIKRVRKKGKNLSKAT